MNDPYSLIESAKMKQSKPEGQVLALCAVAAAIHEGARAMRDLVEEIRKAKVGNQ